MKFLKIPEATIKRLSVYARYLSNLDAQDRKVISSAELAEECGMNAAQIRKDLAYFGEFGVRGVGYYVKDLLFDIRRILGLNKSWRVALVGVGRLGEALLSYSNFPKQGYHFVAAFDVDPAKIGRPVGPANLEILPLSELPRVVAERGVEIGIITAPASAAQEVADRLVDAKVTGILNFAPARITVPEGVIVKHVDLTQEFDNLAYLMVSRQG
ncbi:MAG TPA: redox-sensing transcriptional repressor Rex [Thermodesulfobacteriota bacterium]|nr:redox-sensing transcriptional repressor Rex [Thermodesulfobacteriota bacterium]